MLYYPLGQWEIVDASCNPVPVPCGWDVRNSRMNIFTDRKKWVRARKPPPHLLTEPHGRRYVCEGLVGIRCMKGHTEILAKGCKFKIPGECLLPMLVEIPHGSLERA